MTAETSRNSPAASELAAEYRTRLFGLVAGKDPREIQRHSGHVLRAERQRAIGVERRVPAEGKWSASEVLGHVADAEIVAAFRYRQILGYEVPALPAYDQDRWVVTQRHGESDPSAALDLFDAVRSANLALWERVSDPDRRRLGVHEERGRESLEELFMLMAGHDLSHIGQLRETIDAALASDRNGPAGRSS